MGIRGYTILTVVLYILITVSSNAQQKRFDEAGAGNPLLPGYFADPTVKKFGDTYYIYATTDGNGGGFGPAQVWISKDFVNWSLQDMNWPTTHHYWAPDVTQAADGKYYMYYCQPVEIFGAWSTTPVGPWTPLLPDKQPVVKNFLVPNVITLDGQTFRDDDGKMYMFWGTWGIYPDHGCGVGLFNADMKSFAKLAQIPNTVAKEFFEAPFMFKRKGIYYLTYSSGRCEDDTYRVQYAVSKTGPMGPFEFGKNNPVLSTSADDTVHGPGHQSVLQEGDDFYLIYHRHNNPHSGGGYHRQIAADKIVFDAEGNIEKLIPSHNGVSFLAKNANPSTDLLFGKAVTASSFYSEDFKPKFAVDHNNGTLWKPRNNTSDSWICIDLEKVEAIKSVQTQFEYATWYYQYLLEYSTDGKLWKVFADRRKNTIHGSPMIDIGNVKARYLRLSITNTEYPGLNKGIWNIRAFSDQRYHPQMAVKAKDSALTPHIKPKGLLVDLDAKAFNIGMPVKEWKNEGALGGSFMTTTAGLPTAEIVSGKKAVVLAGKTFLKSNFPAPASLSGNSSFTVSMWLNNPVMEDEEPVISWTARGGVDMTNATVGYGFNKKWGAAAHWGWADMPYQNLPKAGVWHHIALVFDGTTEKLYVDGKLDRQELKMLYLANLTNFVLGSTVDQNAFYSGAIASLKVYDNALTEQEVINLANTTINSEVAVYLDPSKLPYGEVSKIANAGFAADEFNFIKSNGKSTAPQIEDFKGKIALTFTKGSSLQLKLNSDLFNHQQPYTIAYVTTGKSRSDAWHHIIEVWENGSRITYVDGKSIGTETGSKGVKALPQLLGKMDEGTLQMNIAGLDMALSSFMLYNRAFDTASVADLYQQWKNNNESSISDTAFEVKPTALSPQMVTMSAAVPKMQDRVYQYSFLQLKGDKIVKSSGWIDSPDYIDYGIEPDTEYSYSLKIKDNYGNVGTGSKAFQLSTSKQLFNLYESSFSESVDFTKDFKKGMWDGLVGKADVAASNGGTLKLASTGTNWDGNDPLGPFLYRNVTGNFIVEVTVVDVSGLQEKKANGANDAGLMLRDASNFNLVQNSIFPGWAIGNMVTSLDSNGRAQNNNQTGWNYYPKLQIQRRGNTFYLRGSNDGKTWTELPGSPLQRPDLGATLQVGLFHATYGRQSGFGTFDNFRLIQLKK